MATQTLSFVSFRGGLWSGTLVASGGAASDDPEVIVRSPDGADRPAQVASRADALGAWDVTFSVAADDLNQGVCTYLILDSASGDVLDRFVLIAGKPADEDLIAEVALLRAELDVLKAALRGHVRDTTTG